MDTDTVSFQMPYEKDSEKTPNFLAVQTLFPMLKQKSYQLDKTTFSFRGPFSFVYDVIKIVVALTTLATAGTLISALSINLKTYTGAGTSNYNTGFIIACSIIALPNLFALGMYHFQKFAWFDEENDDSHFWHYVNTFFYGPAYLNILAYPYETQNKVKIRSKIDFFGSLIAVIQLVMFLYILGRSVEATDSQSRVSSKTLSAQDDIIKKILILFATTAFTSLVWVRDIFLYLFSCCFDQETKENAKDVEPETLRGIDRFLVKNIFHRFKPGSCVFNRETPLDPNHKPTIAMMGA